MFIRVDEIHPTLSITIQGNEPWLDAIVRNLQEGEAQSPSKITGQVQFRKDSAGFVYGQGNIKHTPMLSCSRCAMDIPWPLDVDFQATWRPPFESHTPKEMALSAEDLDTYFMVDGKINLEELVNDVLQCELPDQVLIRKENSDDCGVCGVNLLNNLVYGSDKPIERSSPFAVLKNLKST